MRPSSAPAPRRCPMRSASNAGPIQQILACGAREPACWWTSIGTAESCSSWRLVCRNGQVDDEGVMLRGLRRIAHQRNSSLSVLMGVNLGHVLRRPDRRSSHLAALSAMGLTTGTGARTAAKVPSGVDLRLIRRPWTSLLTRNGATPAEPFDPRRRTRAPRGRRSGSRSPASLVLGRRGGCAVG